MISKFKNAQLVFVDGNTPLRIKRSFSENGNYLYEMRETGEILPESRLSLLKN
jgi:hypothetical protein